MKKEKNEFSDLLDDFNQDTSRRSIAEVNDSDGRSEVVGDGLNYGRRIDDVEDDLSKLLNAVDMNRS